MSRAAFHTWVQMMDELSLTGRAEGMCDHLWGALKHYYSVFRNLVQHFQPDSDRQAQSHGESHSCLLPVSGFESLVQPSHPAVRFEPEQRPRPQSEADHTVRSFEVSAQDRNNYRQVPWSTAQCQVPCFPAQKRHCGSSGGQTQQADGQA